MRKLLAVIVAIIVAMAVAGCGVASNLKYQTVQTVTTFKLGDHYQSYVVRAACPTHWQAVAGGYSAPLAGVGSRWGVDSYDGYIAYDGPDGNTWRVESYVKNKQEAGTKFTLRAYAVCLK